MLSFLLHMPFFGRIEHHESMVNNKFQLPGMCSYVYIYTVYLLKNVETKLD